MNHTGTYRGIIIQNNDPRKEGRVKVFVPGINLQQLENWNTKKEEDKAFKVLGSNTNSSITLDILKSQKERLFWAEVMLPLFGMSSPGFYHAPADTFSIGNDSDYTFQSSKKSTQLFASDRSVAEERINSPIIFSNPYVQPRTQITLNFGSSGRKFCFNSGCNSNSSNIPAFWRNSYADDCLNKLKNSLPKTYSVVPLSSYQVPNNNPDINTRISDITIDVTNPTIFINDQEIPKSNPIYGYCVEKTAVDSDVISFSPPIVFEDGDGGDGGKLADAPISISVNSSKTLNNKFKIESSDETKIVYRSNNIKVVVPKKNVRSINVKSKGKPFDLSKILALAPILIQLYNGIVMPRASMTSTQQYSRGGGGGEIYNNVTTKNLDKNQRANSHIGGANNESKFTVNKGRVSLNDDNMVKGNNVQQGNLQIYRGPLRAADYNNDWKGIISIPGVGSHVWVIFENGDVNYPIIVGTYAAQNDYKGVFESK
jgi:hypothetical protein